MNSSARTPAHLPANTRLMRGRRGWWCVGPGGTALVPRSLVSDGRLTVQGMAEVGRLGLLTPPTDHYNITVVTATGCNLGCPYCFQNTGPAEPGRYDPPRIKRLSMSSGVVDAVVSFTRARMTALGVSRLNVLLFGGEPLLNPFACLEVLRRCAELGDVRGSMISNGVALRVALAQRLCDAGLRSVQVAVDGQRDCHDRLRTTRRGGGTFDTIVTNVAAAQAATCLRFTFRINMSAAALPGIEGLLTDLATRIDPRRTGLGFAPIHDYGWSSDGLLDPSPRTAARIVAAYARAHQLGFRVRGPGPDYCAFCTDERGRRGAVIGADGSLFSCWESVGRRDYEVGTAADGYRHYPADRWVRCGSLVRHATPERFAHFRDEVDAGLLDLLWHHRTVQRKRPLATTGETLAAGEGR
jgi:uncharacterized protein